MSSNDIFNYSASVAVLIAAATLVYLVYQITLSLKTLRKILEDVGETTADVNAIRRVVKRGLLSFGSIFGRRVQRGGVLYGKKQSSR